jgi:hypothetical protein
VDCVNVRWRECYAPHHPGHLGRPLTRTQDLANRMGMYRYLHELGLVYGGELMQAYAVPAVDYCHGMGIPFREPSYLRLFQVPLWHLAFHDALVPYGHSTYTSAPASGFADIVLRDLLLGAPPLYFFSVADYPQWRDRIALAECATGEIVRAIAFDEMLSHAFLTDDHQVQRSRFSSGVEITVNTGTLEREAGLGCPVPAQGFLVTGIAGGPRVGSFGVTYRGAP